MKIPQILTLIRYLQFYILDVSRPKKVAAIP